jgi:hypothetical protein
VWRPDGGAVSASSDNTLKVWNLESGALVATFTCNTGAKCCTFAVGQRIIAGDSGRASPFSVPGTGGYLISGRRKRHAEHLTDLQGQGAGGATRNNNLEWTSQLPIRHYGNFAHLGARVRLKTQFGPGPTRGFAKEPLRLHGSAAVSDRPFSARSE